MKKLSEASIGAYVESLIERNVPLKKTIDRHFQGIVTAVSCPDNNWPFIVNIKRTEGSDDNDWTCAIPGYVPKVGDVVECEWKDEHSGYIKFPLKYQRFVASVGQASAQAIATSATTLNFDTIITDPYNCFDATLTSFICPYNGIYKVGGAFTIGSAAQSEIWFYKNGSVYRRPALANAMNVSSGTAIIPCLLGDILTLVAQIPGGAQNTIPGISNNWFDIEYLGPL